MSEYIQQGINNGFLANQYNNSKSIGVLLDRITNNQPYMYITAQLNKWYQTNSQPDFQIFHLFDDPPFFFPPTGLFRIVDLQHRTGPTIATSMSTLDILIKQWRIQKKYWYVYDVIDFLSPDFSKKIRELVAANIVLIFRSSDHKDEISRRYPELKESMANVIVPDFNIAKLMEVMNG